MKNKVYCIIGEIDGDLRVVECSVVFTPEHPKKPFVTNEAEEWVVPARWFDNDGSETLFLEGGHKFPFAYTTRADAVKEACNAARIVFNEALMRSKCIMDTLVRLASENQG